VIIPYPLKDGTHKVISGTLRHIGIFKKNQLRYHFDGFVVDTYVAIVRIGFYDIGHYKYEIEHVNAMTNIPVTLELIEKNGENYLMKISYNEDLSESKTEPLTPAEKSNLLKSAGIRLGCVGFLLLTTGMLYGCMKGFGKGSLPVILIFLVAPFLLTLLIYYIPRRQRIKDSQNKIVLTTIIREVITIVIPPIDSDSTSTLETSYRMGTGELIKHDKMPLSPEDKVRLYYTEKNGKTDWLIKLEKLS
jgi:hypothetical protein